MQIDEPTELEIEMVGTTIGESVTGMILLVAVFGDAQAELLINSQVTKSPLFKELIVSVELFVPTTVPFTFHVYVGLVPPLVAVALKMLWLP
jgi:hypothetical protein